MSAAPTAPWAMTADTVLRKLETSEHGLTRKEALRRLQKDGPNALSESEGAGAARIFLRQFSSPLVVLLIGASLVSFGLGERTETVIILMMTLLGGILGFIQEFRSERALLLLRKKLTRHATVLRDGKKHRIDARDLVKGDIVHIELGTVIPADLRLLTVQDLEVDESTLTGESVPVPKTTSSLAKNHRTPQEQTNMVFLGTHVVQGSSLGVVVATGAATEMGLTASLLAKKTDETSFQRGVHAFGALLLKMTIAMAIIVALILGLLRGQWGEAVLFALALAVGISPELLPVIVTLNLSRGALAMSKKHVLVKRLISIEDLGDADVFCTDKTGTLTVGTLRVRGGVDPDGAPSPVPLSLAAHCLDIGSNGKATNAVDEAIRDALHAKKDISALAESRIVDLISFDFTRRRMSCVLENTEGIRRLIVKGAAAEIFDVCTSRVTKNGQLSRPLTTEDRSNLMRYVQRMEADGVRLVAVAQRDVAEQDRYAPKDEHDLELVGFILVSDAPKETAKAALESLQALNVRIVILTGDNPNVTRYVASQIGFGITGILTGDDIEGMDAHALSHAAESTNVFARITPAHKLRILNALKAAGHRVGYMGDGVNDAPALRAADVGISFDSAVDVAKEAAGVILLQKNLSVLADGIREGRKTFVKTHTYIKATISSNFGNMLSVAGAALLLPFIPLLPSQILLLNLLSDFPMLMIPTDRVPAEEIARPKKWDVGRLAQYMYYFGTISSVADYATFALLLFAVRSNPVMFRSGWFIESMLTEVVVIFLLRTRRLSLANRPSAPLVVASIAMVGATLFLVESRLGAAFELVPIGAKTLGAIALIVLGYAVLTEFGKVAYYRFQERNL